MKDKISILHERALITCVVMLFVCIIFKLFGVQWFNLDTNIPVLQEIDRIIMSSVPLSFLYSFIMLSINTWFIMMIANRLELKEGFKVFIYTIPFIIISIFVKNLYIDGFVEIIYDFITLLIINVYINKGFKNTLNIVKVLLLSIIYQIISLYIRSLGCTTGHYGLMISVLLSLDYYIMLVITYLYLIGKENKNV